MYREGDSMDLRTGDKIVYTNEGSTIGPDRRWSDKYLPQIRAIVGPRLLVPSSLDRDRNEGADLVVLTGRNVTIACRVRRHGYAERYPKQFTVRSHRDTGMATELAKIRAGWGDWMFYGHEVKHAMDICPWWLIDLGVFRTLLTENEARTVPYALCDEAVPNFDGTYFNAYHLDRFPPNRGLIIAWRS
jgi:hypothetical protein